MDGQQTSLIIAFISCLVVSGFISGSEVAFFSLKGDHLPRLLKSSDSQQRLISILLEDPQKLLITILVTNNIVNIAASIIAATLTLDLLTAYGIDPVLGFTIEILVLTFVFLILAEITPKVIAANMSLEYARLAVQFVYLLNWLLTPVSSIFMVFTRVIKIKRKRNGEVSGDDLKTIADVVKEQGNLEESEREIIHSLAEFSELTVRDIMNSRMDIVAIDTNTSFDDAISLINEKGHSRIPVYESSLDHIQGILYAKDLIPLMNDLAEIKKFDPLKIAREPLYIPEGKKVNELLKEFQSQHMHIAIVVDEYGGTSGLVTMEDVIEQIIGDIQDENENEQPQYKKTGPNCWEFEGKIPLEDAEEILNHRLNLKDEKVETLAGFLLLLYGAIPETDVKISHQNIEFTILEMESRRISKVKAELKVKP